MQLQRQLSRKHKGKEYPKYTVVIPPKKIEKLGWMEGQELSSEANGGRLIIRPKKKL
ncbi:MAG: AbrB/MazE/SpoVT family DNA-binding domain-containing protein [Methanocellales archaeon]|nr:AbrB/MazE/SpoVT family DNA-binding domain-containing protein [Methanocellales archaeon]MDD3292236.1 AbrB/MazE/SpoVT family DNA-binding domain-containing protein [Methanocellales archaeon]MDD5234778.1 AbrB/MazE/SpoVT family DNA-binding domain-containing protein [Methanocellales archaeon]MDD5484852.1 AbrB/MazE/SpoVT family DNA-binding domain-containing protein [Methanocellales archaeon]